MAVPRGIAPAASIERRSPSVRLGELAGATSAASPTASGAPPVARWAAARIWPSVPSWMGLFVNSQVEMPATPLTATTAVSASATNRPVSERRVSWVSATAVTGSRRITHSYA